MVISSLKAFYEGILQAVTPSDCPSSLRQPPDPQVFPSGGNAEHLRHLSPLERLEFLVSLEKAQLLPKRRFAFLEMVLDSAA